MVEVRLEELGDKLSQVINEYSSEVKMSVLKRLDNCADEILDYIQKTAPKGSSGGVHLADSFIKTEVGEGVNKTIYISSKTKGRIVHLIELGFRHISGKHVAARPFLRPSFDTFTPKLLEEIRSIIRNGTT